MADEHLTIGALATATGVATSALRYWEQLGLLPAPTRVSGQRRYPESAVRMVGLIIILRDVGFALREIKEMLPSSTEAPDAWQEQLKRKLAELDERISQAQVARTAIAHGLVCPHGEGMLECPNFNRIVSARLAGQSLREAHSH